MSGQMCGGSHWTGQLSTSALSTATAVSALSVVRDRLDELTKLDCGDLGFSSASELAAAIETAIQSGVDWLVQYQNADGGFGDTDRSHSNIATSLLALAAWQLSGQADGLRDQTARAWGYVDSAGGWEGLRSRYGKDKTFVVPILSNCALAGFVQWSEVAALPFEAAWLPQEWYRLARMPVVSYAVPALVAIGQASFYHSPPRNPLIGWIRKHAVAPTLRVLRRMQPGSGGYLEAVPLTSFVLMNLASTQRGHLPVSRDCLRFILTSRLEDGSWPIDTNLATWVTSLSMQALSKRDGDSLSVSLEKELDEASQPIPLPTAPGKTPTSPAEPPCHQQIPARTARWLLSCQHKSKHPFTGANPGGWGWTDLSGAVPDADDTPSALLALRALDLQHPRYLRLRAETELAVAQGIGWLYRLQNRDGGWPTFCRGWGRLPFDRSGTDLTAHAVRAITAWLPDWERIGSGPERLPSRHDLVKAIGRGMKFLSATQLPDGSWLPLWFGNQDRTNEDNPVYGTSKVLLAFAQQGLADHQEAQRALQYLRASQNSDGGWGGGPSVRYGTGGNLTDQQENSAICSTIEESSLAIEALIQCGGHPYYDASIMRGLDWLTERVNSVDLAQSWPIGFYFAKLWYHERLYPTIFALSALGTALQRLSESQKQTGSLPSQAQSSETANVRNRTIPPNDSSAHPRMV